MEPGTGGVDVLEPGAGRVLAGEVGHPSSWPEALQGCMPRAPLVVLLVVGTDTGEASQRDVRLAALYQRYRAELLRLAIGLTGDSGLAEEIVQDAFARVLGRGRVLRDQRAASYHLRRAVVAGQARAARRRPRRVPPPGESGGGTTRGGAGAAGHGAVLAAVRRLPPRSRACLLLRFYAGLSEAETADVLALPARTVKNATEDAMEQVAAAAPAGQGAHSGTAHPGVLAQELAGRLRAALDQVPLPERSWPTCLADLAGRARRRRLRHAIAAVSAMVVAFVVAAVLVVAPGRQGRGPGPAGRLSFRPTASVWFHSPSARLAYGGGWLFAVLTDPARLVRLDPATLAVTGRLSLGRPGFNLDPIVYGDGWVWVVGSAGRQLWRIDPATMRVTRRQSTGGHVTAVAYGDGALWLAGSGLTGPAGAGIGLERFDPGSGRLTGSASLPGNRSSHCPGQGRTAAGLRLGDPAVALAAGRVILVAGPGTPVYAVNPRKLSILRAFQVGSGCGAPVELAAGPRGLYATADSAVVRLDLTTGRIAARGPDTGLNLPVAEPFTAALGGLWYTPAAAYRVGTAIRLDPVTLTVTTRTTIYASELLAVGHSMYASEYGGITRIQVTSAPR